MVNWKEHDRLVEAQGPITRCKICGAHTQGEEYCSVECIDADEPQFPISEELNFLSEGI